MSEKRKKSIIRGIWGAAFILWGASDFIEKNYIISAICLLAGIGLIVSIFFLKDNKQ